MKNYKKIWILAWLKKIKNLDLILNLLEENLNQGLDLDQIQRKKENKKWITITKNRNSSFKRRMKNTNSNRLHNKWVMVSFKKQ